MGDVAGEGYVDRYSEAMKVLLGARSGEPLLELARELVASITLEQDEFEFSAPLGKRWWTSGLVSQIGDGTHFAQVEVFNPAVSNVLEVVTDVWSINPSANSIVNLILDGTASGGALVQPINLDTRFSGRAGIQISPSKPDLAIGGQQVIDVMEQLAAATAQKFVNLPVALFPGHRLKVENNAVNIAISVVFRGYERQLVPGEDKTR